MGLFQFLRKPEYLAIVISSLAVCVSLFAPISALLAKSDLIISLPGSISAGTNLGHFSIRPAVSILNTGSAAGEFSRIECAMSDSTSGRLVQMSAETIQTPTGASPLTAYPLPPGGIFYNFINCVVIPSAEAIDRHTALLRSVSADLRQRGLQDCSQQYTSQAIEVSPDTAIELQNYFDQTFDIVTGSYVLTISAYNSDNAMVATASAMLEILPGAISEMESAASNFQYGIGVVCPATEVGTVNLAVTRAR